MYVYVYCMYIDVCIFLYINKNNSIGGKTKCSTYKSIYTDCVFTNNKIIIVAMLFKGGYNTVVTGVC